MDPKLIDILMSKESPIDNDLLAAYLANKLNDEQRHTVEAQLEAASAMESDALEGWLQATSREQLPGYAEEINRKLSAQLSSTKQIRKRHKLNTWPMLWMVTATVLLLALMAWLIIYWSR